MTPPTLLSAHEARLRARAVLDPAIWRYLETRADGSGRDRNAAAWREIDLRPKILRGVEATDTRARVLGRDLSLPLLTAPNGRATRYHPDGEAAVLRGAQDAGGGAVLASGVEHALSPLAAIARPGALWAQLYLTDDEDRTARSIQRAVQAGCDALVVTADLMPPTLRGPLPPPPLADWERGLAADPATPLHAAAGLAHLERLVKASPLPVVVKGVQRGDDAHACVEAGARALIVSNHGDAQISGAAPTASILAEVVQAAGDEAEVYVDGGVRDGATLLRALALGARAVLVGRPVSHALTCDGAAGVEALLEWFRQDLARAMSLCGVASLKDVGPDLVRQR